MKLLTYKLAYLLAVWMIGRGNALRSWAWNRIIHTMSPAVADRILLDLDGRD